MLQFLPQLLLAITLTTALAITSAQAGLRADSEACERKIPALKQRYRLQKQWGDESYEQSKEYNVSVSLLKDSSGMMTEVLLNAIFFDSLESINKDEILKAAEIKDPEKQDLAFHSLLAKKLGNGVVEQGFYPDSASGKELVTHTRVSGARAFACLGIRSIANKSDYQGGCVEVTKDQLIWMAKKGGPLLRIETNYFISLVIRNLHKPESFVDERDYIASQLTKAGLYCPEYTPVALNKVEDSMDVPEKRKSSEVAIAQKKKAALGQKAI